MSAAPRGGPSILEILAQPPRCWCCQRTFGEESVWQLPANREWLAYQIDDDTSALGICEECAEKRDACPRCGRVPGIEAGRDDFRWTQALRRRDKARLRAAGLREWVGFCEPCVVRDCLWDDDLFESPPSKKVAFCLATIIARHWGDSLYVSEKGAPVPEDVSSKVEQVAALVCASLIRWPRNLRFVVENEARDPSCRRALHMYADRFMGQEDRMPSPLRDWVRRRDAGDLRRQRSNKPVFRHANRLIALILVHISNLLWVKAAGMKQTRGRETDPNKALCICDAVVAGLGELGLTIEYEAVKQIGRRYTSHGAVADMRAAHWLAVRELAGKLGNVTEACRHGGMDRTTYYKLKRRYETRGLPGLTAVPSNRRNHPRATPPDTVVRIVALALEHPNLGCNRLETLLAEEGLKVSPPTIQKILNAKGLRTRRDRRSALELTKADRF